MTTKTQNYKIFFDHADLGFCEIQDSEGNLRRVTREQATAIQKLMPHCHWQVIRFRDYSQK